MGFFSKNVQAGRRRVGVGLLGAFFLCMACGFGVARMQLYPFKIRQDMKIVPDTNLYQMLSLDHEGSMADMLFIQVCLHSGGLAWKPLYITFDSTWAYKMMDVVIELDPKFYSAYIFSAMGLIHAFDDVKLAEPILQKGMKVFPDSWELPFWAGYGHYNHLMDYKKASKYMWEAFNKPNAPKYYLALMHAAMKENGEFLKAAEALKVMVEHTKNENKKRILAQKVIRLENFAVILKAARRYEADTQKDLQSLDELILSDYLPQIPMDPLGVEYGWSVKRRLPILIYPE